MALIAEDFAGRKAEGLSLPAETLPRTAKSEAMGQLPHSGPASPKQNRAFNLISQKKEVYDGRFSILETW